MRWRRALSERQAQITARWWASLSYLAACQRDEWSLRQLLPSGSDPGDQELQHDVELDVLHLHQVAEGDGLQGEPEEVPLA